MQLKILPFVSFLAYLSIRTTISCPILFKNNHGKSFKIGEIDVENCSAQGKCQQGLIYQQTMTPTWLEAHASYIYRARKSTADQITFTTGHTANAVLFRVALIPPGLFKKPTPLTIEITLAMDISIGQSTDSDIIFGVSDGSKFVGFMIADKSNYHDHAPCYGAEGIPGKTLRYLKTNRKREPRTRDSFYPGQFVFTLKLDEKRGYCYTAQDGGYVKTDGYSKQLSLNNGLTLEAYKDDDARERYGIKLIKVAITKDAV